MVGSSSCPLWTSKSDRARLTWSSMAALTMSLCGRSTSVASGKASTTGSTISMAEIRGTSSRKCFSCWLALAFFSALVKSFCTLRSSAVPTTSPRRVMRVVISSFLAASTDLASCKSLICCISELHTLLIAAVMPLADSCMRRCTAVSCSAASALRAKKSFRSWSCSVAAAASICRMVPSRLSVRISRPSACSCLRLARASVADISRSRTSSSCSCAITLFWPASLSCVSMRRSSFRRSISFCRSAFLCSTATISVCASLRWALSWLACVVVSSRLPLVRATTDLAAPSFIW
mmetsp:Transcript_9601/g.27498  ORF Transcript_9601/g.27498 Transcript_9601/m.27498 type:complete len:292 (+) Transcript_9601:2670-3545(+)